MSIPLRVVRSLLPVALAALGAGRALAAPGPADTLVSRLMDEGHWTRARATLALLAARDGRWDEVDAVLAADARAEVETALRLDPGFEPATKDLKRMKG